MSVANPDAQWRLIVTTADLVQPAWAYQSWPGRYADADTQADLPASVLVDPCIIDFKFTDGQVPSQLDPSTLTFTIWARTVADLPANLQRGTLLSWQLTLYPWAPGIPNPVKNPNEILLWDVTGGRISEVQLVQVPGSAWAARATVKATDLLVDLPSVQPAVPDGSTIRRKLRERLVQMSHFMGIGVGLPTGTPDGANPPIIGPGGGVNGPRCNVQWQGSAREQLSAWSNANDVLPGAIACPYYNSDVSKYANGYGSPVPAVPFGGALTDYWSRVKVMMAPATAPNPNKLPLRLVKDSTNTMVLQYAPEADQHTAALDGAVVEVPGVLRSGREHAPNMFRFSGQAEGLDASVTPNVVVERNASYDYYPPTSDTATTGPRGRELPTLLEIGTFDPAHPENGNTVVSAAVTLMGQMAAPFVSDAYALSQTWAYDAITVRVDKMSVAQTRAVVPELWPLYPTGDGGSAPARPAQLVRHVTLYNLPAGILRPDTPLPQGHVSAGRVNLEAGRMTMELTFTPAGARSTGSRITVADVDAASWHAVPAGNIDRDIRVADLALVDA